MKNLFKNKYVLFTCLVIVSCMTMFVLSGCESDSDAKVEQSAKNQQSEKDIQRAREVLESIRQSSSFVAMNYYEEIVVSQGKEKSGLGKVTSTFFGGNKRAKIVLLVKGTVRTAFDFSKIGDEDIRVSGSTLYLTLPASEIIETQIDAEDIEVIDKEGSWSDEEIKTLKQKGVEMFETRISNSGIMNKSDRKGVERLTKIFKATGFTDVVCEVNR